LSSRGHDFKLSKPRSNQLFFTNRIINQWNSLPSSLINAHTTSVLKNRLDQYWTESRYGHNEKPKATAIFVDHKLYCPLSNTNIKVDAMMLANPPGEDWCPTGGAV